MKSAAIVSAVSSYGRSGSSSRVRVYDWLDHLGYQSTVMDYLGRAHNRPVSLMGELPHVMSAERRLRRQASHIRGTVLLSREASPLSNGGVESRILKSADRGVYDFDDALFAYPRSGLQRMWSRRKVWAAAVAAADVVIAGNDYLADAAATISNSVVMIPSCVEPSAYQRKESYAITDAPTAVWIGSPSTERYLRQASSALLNWHARSNLRLVVVSAGHRSLGELDRMTTRIPWSMSAFPEILGAADFGIMPLDDDAYSRGKCAYKLLQYGASALPVVASPVGASAVALERLGGIAADSPASWDEAIEAVITAEPGERREWGARAAAGVDRHYSYDAWAVPFEKALFG